MFANVMRSFLGDSMYEWALQMGQVMDNMWNSLMVWRILALILFLVLIVRHYRRPV